MHTLLLAVVLALTPTVAWSQSSCEGRDCCVKGSTGGRCLRAGEHPVRGDDGQVHQVRYVQVKKKGSVVYGLADLRGRTLIRPTHKWLVPLSPRAAFVPGEDGGGALLVDGERREIDVHHVLTVSVGSALPPISYAVVKRHDAADDLAALGPMGELGTVIRGVERVPWPERSVLHIGGFVVLGTVDDGVETTVFADLAGEPFWAAREVEILQAVRPDGDGSCVADARRLPEVAVVRGTSPLSFGRHLLHPLDSATAQPIALPDGVVGLVPVHSSGCYAGWVIVSRDASGLVYRVAVGSPADVLARMDALEPLSDVVRVYPTVGVQISYRYNGGVVAGLPKAGGGWIARPALSAEIALGSGGVEATPFAAAEALMRVAVAEAGARDAEILRRQAEIDVRAASRQTWAAERFEALLRSGTKGDLAAALGLAIYELGLPWIERVLPRVAVTSMSDAEAICRYEAGDLCAGARAQAAAFEAETRAHWAAQDAAARPYQGSGSTVEVRSYDAHGNYLGTSTMPAWQADIVSW